MNDRPAPAARPPGAAARPATIMHPARLLRQRLPRLFFFAGVSSLLGVVMLAAKLGLFVAAPDLFLLANIVFAAGAIAAKLDLLRRRAAIRKMDAASARFAEELAYRRTGTIIVALSVGYLLILAVGLYGSHGSHGNELWAGICIAVVAFTELVLSVVAAIAGRHDAAPLASAVRRINLANAIVLIALAQSALTPAPAEGVTPPSAVTALGFGIAAAAVGVDMLIRSWRSAAGRNHSSPAGPVNRSRRPFHLARLTPPPLASQRSPNSAPDLPGETQCKSPHQFPVSHT